MSDQLTHEELAFIANTLRKPETLAALVKLVRWFASLPTQPQMPTPVGGILTGGAPGGVGAGTVTAADIQRWADAFPPVISGFCDLCRQPAVVRDSGSNFCGQCYYLATGHSIECEREDKRG